MRSLKSILFLKFFQHVTDVIEFEKVPVLSALFEIAGDGPFVLVFFKGFSDPS